MMKQVRTDPHDIDPVRNALPPDEEVERRAEEDRALKSRRAEASVTLLHQTGSCAVIAAQKASLEDFKIGLEAKIGPDKDGQARVLWLPAKGTIQDADFDQEKTGLQAISALRRASGFVVVGFEDVDFDTKIGVEGNRIAQRVTSIVDRQDSNEREDLRHRRNLGHFAQLYKDRHSRDFGVLYLGRGGVDDLARSTRDRNELISLFVPRLALLESGELDSNFPSIEAAGKEDGPDSPQTQLPI